MLAYLTSDAYITHRNEVAFWGVRSLWNPLEGLLRGWAIGVDVPSWTDIARSFVCGALAFGAAKEFDCCLLNISYTIVGLRCDVFMIVIL
jgi:hypothetical protein